MKKRFMFAFLSAEKLITMQQVSIKHPSLGRVVLISTDCWTGKKVLLSHREMETSFRDADAAPRQGCVSLRDAENQRKGLPRHGVPSAQSKDFVFVSLLTVDHKKYFDIESNSCVTENYFLIV